MTRKLPDFGQCLALDGKAISSHARLTRKEGAAQAADGRRETDADSGVTVYQGQHAHGTAWEKQVSWFGFRLHLLVHAQYELPVAFKVTRAASEVRCARQLLDALQERQPWLLERGEQFLADRGYADSKF
ncbi:MAG: transposase [Bacillota bacterium]